MNETPEQWADRIIETLFCDGVHVSDDTGLRLDPNIRDAMFAELAAVKRKADASDLWRGEALYAGESLAGDDLGHAQCEMACTARINAGLQ